MKQGTKKTLADLKRRRDSGNQNMFEMIKGAERVIGDADWINEFHGGDPIAAVESLEHEFFAMLAGSPTLGQLLTAIRKFPDESQWSEYRYSPRVMVDLSRESDVSDREPVVRHSYKKEADELQEQLSDLKFSHKRDRETIQALTQQLEQLKEDNARLRGKIEALTEQVAA